MGTLVSRCLRCLNLMNTNTPFERQRRAVRIIFRLATVVALLWAILSSNGGAGTAYGAGEKPEGRSAEKPAVQAVGVEKAGPSGGARLLEALRNRLQQAGGGQKGAVEMEPGIYRSGPARALVVVPGRDAVPLLSGPEPRGNAELRVVQPPLKLERWPAPSGKTAP
jgi:hypothetical protein